MRPQHRDTCGADLWSCSHHHVFSWRIMVGLGNIFGEELIFKLHHLQALLFLKKLPLQELEYHLTLSLA